MIANNFDNKYLRFSLYYVPHVHNTSSSKKKTYSSESEIMLKNLQVFHTSKLLLNASRKAVNNKYHTFAFLLKGIYLPE